MNVVGHELLTKKQIFLNALQYGWTTLTQHTVLLSKACLSVILGFLIPMYTCWVVVILAGVALYMHIVYQQTLLLNMSWVVLLGVSLFLIASLIAVVAFAGIIRFFLELHDQGVARLKTLFSGFKYLPRFIGFGITLMCIVMVILGLILAFSQLIMRIGRLTHYEYISTNVGIAVAIFLVFFVLIHVFMRLAYALYIIVDVNNGIISAMRASWKLTQGFVLWLFLVHLVVYVPVSLVNIFLEKVHVEGLPVIIDFVIFQLLPLLINFPGTIIVIAAHARFYRLLQARQISMNGV